MKKPTMYPDRTELYPSGKWSDLTLLIAETEFKVHKAVVIASKVLSDLLEEFQHDKIDITELVDNPVTFDNLLLVLYGRKVTFSKEYIATLVKCADKLLIPNTNQWYGKLLPREVKIRALNDMYKYDGMKWDMKRLNNMTSAGDKEAFSKGHRFHLLGQASYTQLMNINSECIEQMDDNTLEFTYILHNYIKKGEVAQVDMEDGVIFDTFKVIVAGGKLIFINPR